MDYWGDYPPTHLLVRAYMGMGKGGGKKAATRVKNDADIAAFLGDVERVQGK